jgi:predicted dehydrogenase
MEREDALMARKDQLTRIGLVDLDTSHPGSFAKILAQMEGVRVTAVYDHGDVWPAGYAERFAQEHGARAVGKPEDMVGEVDGVMVVGTNWDRHLERARIFLEAGVATFVDKVVVGRVRDGIGLMEAAQRGRAPLMGGSSLRYAVEVAALREQLAPQGGALTAWACGPGDFFNYGIHAVEMLQGAIGGGIRSVRFVGEHGPALFAVNYDDGKVAVLQLHTPGGFRVTVCGSKGSASTDVDAGPCYQQMLTRFVEMVRTGEPPTPFAESLEAVKVLLAARRARATGETVYLDDLTADEGFDGEAFILEYGRQRRAAG